MTAKETDHALMDGVGKSITYDNAILKIIYKYFVPVLTNENLND